VKEQEHWMNFSSMAMDRLQPWNKTMTVHIGKASYGWVFLFHGRISTPFDSRASWFKWLTENNVRIVNEEGDECSVETLFEDIENYWSPNTKRKNDRDFKNKQHMDYCLDNGYTSELKYGFTDNEGYPISMNTFS
jgi:hypothetical protein